MPGRDDIELARDGGSWKVNGKPADTPFVNEFFSSVAGLEAIEFPDAGTPRSSEAPSTVLAFTHVANTAKESEGQPKPVTQILKVGPQVATPVTGYLAAVEGDQETRIVSQESFRKITPRLESLLKSESAPEAKSLVAPEDSAVGQ
ncbi:MAG: hypothetical protein EBZ48_03890 [Proteobacteria bacterium]|nr:hypothetical protein [Pseudomonadota bacterium]